MERFEHGGNIYRYPGVLDFSASLNPLGMPASAREALRTCADACAAYPDPSCHALTEAIAVWEGVDAGWVLPCAGATDALTRVCQLVGPDKREPSFCPGLSREPVGKEPSHADKMDGPSRALACAPGYLGYEQAAEQAGLRMSFYALDAAQGFAVDTGLADAIDAGTRLVFLANPNNPTGVCLRRDVLLACLDQASRVGALVVLDECFADLAGIPGSCDLLATYPNLLIVKALTKTFSLAGLRVGYALCSDGELLGRLRTCGQPWAVSTPAQLAGVACLGERGNLDEAIALIGRERARLCAALASCGMEPVVGQANFILFRGSADLFARLLERGILVRDCANFRGLGPGWYRVAVRAPHDNDRLMAALEEVVR